MFKIIFHPEVDSDLKNFDQNFKNLIFKKLEKIKNNPEIWKDLWNKNWMDLSGLKKVYLDRKKIRIVYQILNEKLIIFIVWIWKREKMEIYKKIKKRI